MKKNIVVVALVVICALGLWIGSSNGTDKKTPVFETENISRITVFSLLDSPEWIEVPYEYMDEITAWIGTFRIDCKINELNPGDNTYCFRIEYSDGSIVESGINTTTINGMEYRMKDNEPPKCFYALFPN